MVRKQYVKKDDIKIILANDMNECKFFGLISKIQDRLHQGIETKEFIKVFTLFILSSSKFSFCFIL